MIVLIRLAARTLPAAIRDRYREQWLADARDAAEAGLRPASITLAAVSFALAVPRPLERRRTDAPDVPARARLASALALSACVVGVSQFGSFGNNEGLTSNSVYNFVVFFANALVLLYLVAAPLVAIILASITRGTPARVRVAVWLLAASTVVGALQGTINSIRASSPVGTTLIDEGAAVVLLAMGLAAIACALLIRAHTARAHPRRRSLRHAIAVLGIAIVGLGLGVANALDLRARLHAADVEFVKRVLEGQLEGATAMVAHSEQATAIAITVWAAAGLLGCLVAARVAYVWPRLAVVSLLALAFVQMITHAGVLTYVWLSSFGGPGVHLTVPEAVLLLVGRWGLVAVILYSVGGSRLLTRVSHAHDVKGGVELL